MVHTSAAESIPSHMHMWAPALTDATTKCEANAQSEGRNAKSTCCTACNMSLQPETFDVAILEDTIQLETYNTTKHGRCSRSITPKKIIASTIDLPIQSVVLMLAVIHM